MLHIPCIDVKNINFKIKNITHIFHEFNKKHKKTQRFILHTNLFCEFRLKQLHVTSRLIIGPTWTILIKRLSRSTLGYGRDNRTLNITDEFTIKIFSFNFIAVQHAIKRPSSCCQLVLKQSAENM